jgi:hypothetical protein
MLATEPLDPNIDLDSTNRTDKKWSSKRTKYTRINRPIFFDLPAIANSPFSNQSVDFSVSDTVQSIDIAQRI